MIRFGVLRDRLSLQTLIILLALLVAPAFGIAIAAALRGQVLLLIGVGGIIGVFVTLYAPIELLIVAGMFGAMLADSRIVDTDIVYYARFIPTGMLTIRTMLDLALRREQVRSVPSFLLPTLLFLGLATLSITYSYTPALTPLRVLSMAFVILSFGLGLPNYLTTPEKFNRALQAVIVLIAGFVVVGVLAFPTGSQDSTENFTFSRISGFFGNPNTLGLIAMLIFFPLLWWRQSTGVAGLRQVLTVLLIGWGALIVATGSRGSFVGLLGGGAFLFLLYGRASLRFAPWLGVAALLAILFFVAFPEFRRVLVYDTQSDTLVPGTVQVVDRPFLIQRAIELGMRSPIYGVGFGASDRVFQEDKPNLIRLGVYISGSHNSYTRMFVDLGIVGIIIGFSVFVILLGRVLTGPSYIRRDLTVALLSTTVVTGLVNGFFEDWVFGFGNSSTLPFWFFLVLIPIRIALIQNQDTKMETEQDRVHTEATL